MTADQPPGGADRSDPPDDERKVDTEVVLYEVADRVATITLNRPHRLNAWTGRMHAEYRAAVARAELDTGVRAVVVTGAGRGFCAGADIAALDRHVAGGGYDSGLPDRIATPGYGVRPEFDVDFAFHFGLTKPVIAAVNGPAAGVGLALACFCDVRFAAAGAKLTTAHGRLNLPAEYGLSWLLPRLIGLGRATEILLTSRVVLAEEALELGLVSGVVGPEDVAGHAQRFARRLIEGSSRRSLAETRRQIYTDLHRDVASSVRDAQRLLEEMTTEADFARGVAALGEKRSPRFDEVD